MLDSIRGFLLLAGPSDELKESLGRSGFEKKKV